MCKNLVEKGDLDKPLIIFNRTQKRATDLNAKLPSGKSTIASSIEEAVSKADIIFTCLGDDAAIKNIVATALKGNVVITLSFLFGIVTELFTPAVCHVPPFPTLNKHC